MQYNLYPQIHSPSSNRQQARLLFVYFSIIFLSSPFISAIVFIILFIDCSDVLSDGEIPAIAKHITTTEKFYSYKSILQKLYVTIISGPDKSLHYNYKYAASYFYRF